MVQGADTSWQKRCGIHCGNDTSAHRGKSCSCGLSGGGRKYLPTSGELCNADGMEKLYGAINDVVDGITLQDLVNQENARIDDYVI